MNRNSTSFPSQLTAFLRRVYDEYVQLRERSSPESEGSDRKRLAAVLKYYQFLVHEYMGAVKGPSESDPDATRGLLVYHKMGLGKTFDALSVSITAIGATATAMRSDRQASPRRVILIASKSLHANFDKGLKKYLDLFFDGASAGGAAERKRVEAKVKASISYVTMNAHNMADQVLKATRAAAAVQGAPERKGKTTSESIGALDGLLLIVDEAHNFFRAIINSPSPTTNARRLYTMIMGATNLKIMFLTGTPASKHPFELVPCFNMLAGKDLLPTQYDLFLKHFVDPAGHKLKNRGQLANRLVGLVSYAGYDIPESLTKQSSGDKAEQDEQEERFSFPKELDLIVEEVEMSEQQYRQYLMAREKEAGEGGGRGGKGGPGAGAKPPPPLALPGSEREVGSSYYVQSRMFSNFAPPRKYMPTSSVLDPTSITRVDPRLTPEEGGDLPDDAFTANTSPKIAKMMENIAKSPGPFLVYSQFVGIGGLGVVERFLRNEGFERFVPASSRGKKTRKGRTGGDPISEAAAVSDAAVGGAVQDPSWHRVFDSYTKDELQAVVNMIEAQDRDGGFTFKDQDLFMDLSAKQDSWGNPHLPYHNDSWGNPNQAFNLTNLHHGQRKLFLSELFLLSRPFDTSAQLIEPRAVAGPAIVVYAGAAPGFHLPFLAELFPKTEFYLYDPAVFAASVERHPRLHTFRQFFTDNVAKEWGGGGKSAVRYGRPDFFVCDIRIGAGDDPVKFEKNVKADLLAQQKWVQLMRPTQAAFLKFRPPYVDLDRAAPEGTRMEYLDGRVVYQCWPPRLSTETRLLVDCRPGAVAPSGVTVTPGKDLPLVRYSVRDYESAAFTHNIIVRPWVRFSDRPELNELVEGYDGSWDARAEAACWELYLDSLSGSSSTKVGAPHAKAANAGSSPERTRAVANYMNRLTKVLDQKLVGKPKRPGAFHGHFPGLVGTKFARALARSQRQRMRAKHLPHTVQARAKMLLHEDLRAALQAFPVGPGWVRGINRVALSPQPFFAKQNLHINCETEDSEKRPVSLPAPRNIPLALLGLERPQRSLALGVVYFLCNALKAPGQKASLELPAPHAPCAEGSPAAPDLSESTQKLLSQLFPNVDICDTGSAKARDEHGAEVRERAVFRLRTAAGRKGDWELSYHRDSTVCERCVSGARGDADAPPGAFWACWAPPSAPGTHFHMCPAGSSPPTACRRPPETRSLRAAAAHIVYDRSWSRYQTPVSKRFGPQKLGRVQGFDGCWDCTAEAHIWLGYMHFQAAGASSSDQSAGRFMNLLTSHTDEPLEDRSSGHGRFVSERAASAVAAAASVIKRSDRIHRRRGREARARGGDEAQVEELPAPKYAVISGDVSPEDRRAIQATWVSPENKRGELIKGILVSKTGAEGMDLKYGRQVHLLEPYWDKSLENQVIARFIRIGALDDLPPEERTVQPYLYLATGNSAIRGVIPEDALEVPVAASAELPLGTTVDVAFHKRAQNTQALNLDARKLLETVAIECALYGSQSRDCRICRPTDAVLFHQSYEEDLRIPDPCEVLTESEVDTKTVTLPNAAGTSDTPPTTYHYVVDPTAALGYRFYQPSAEFAYYGDKDEDVYVEVDASTPLYMRLVKAVAP